MYSCIGVFSYCKTFFGDRDRTQQINMLVTKPGELAPSSVSRTHGVKGQTGLEGGVLRPSLCTGAFVHTHSVVCVCVRTHVVCVVGEVPESTLIHPSGK